MLTSIAALYFMSHNDDVMADTEVNIPGKRKHILHVDKAANEHIVIKTEPEKGNLVVDQDNATITYFSDEPQHDTYIYDLVSDDGSAIWWLLGALLIGAGIAAGAGSAGSYNNGGSNGGGGQPQGIDYSDAPESYSFSADETGATILDSPNHTIVPSLFLGSVSPDPDTAARPSPDALEDDMTATADEAVFRQTVGSEPNELSFNVDSSDGTNAGLFASINYNVTNQTGDDAYLSAWIDLNFDGDFDDTGEKIISEFVVSTGANELNLDFTLSLSADDLSFYLAGLNEPINQSYIRFRLSTDESSVTTPYGSSPDGEVEDIEILFTRLNFAPAKIEGGVFNNSGTVGINGVDVTLSGLDFYGAPVNLMATTDVNGMFMINGIPIGSGYSLVTDSPSSYTPPDFSPIDILPGGFDDGFDFFAVK